MRMVFYVVSQFGLNKLASETATYENGVLCKFQFGLNKLAFETATYEDGVQCMLPILFKETSL